jgi:hypothetical protein
MMYSHIHQIPNLEKIKARLKRRGLEIIEDGDWEKHGPHESMLCVVIIGLCRFIGTKEETYAAIYPRRVYELANPCEWHKGELLPVLGGVKE